MLSHVQLFVTPCVARQVPLSMGFFRTKYWGEMTFPSAGDLPDLGIELISPALAGRFSTTWLPSKEGRKKVY